MPKTQSYRMARYFKQLGIPMSLWPIFPCNPVSKMDQEEAIEKSINRHRRNMLCLTKVGRQELRKEKYTETIIRKVFGTTHV